MEAFFDESLFENDCFATPYLSRNITRVQIRSSAFLRFYEAKFIAKLKNVNQVVQITVTCPPGCCLTIPENVFFYFANSTISVLYFIFVLKECIKRRIW